VHTDPLRTQMTKQHKGREAVQGAGRSTRIVTWTGVTEQAMVVDGYTWIRIPGTNLEVRALTDKPGLGLCAQRAASRGLAT
jgi:hypothetical protein